MRSAILLLAILPLHGAVWQRSVCASGCDYVNADLQDAMDDAVTHQASTCEPAILTLTAGETFTAANNGFQFPAKTCAQYIRLRSSKLSELPSGVRVSPSDTSKMAKLVSATADTSPTLGTINGTVTSYWAVEGLEITQPVLASLKYTLILLGESVEKRYADVPHHFIFDRNYPHGLANENGPKACFYINAHHVDLTNNYIAECKSTLGADGQAIAMVQAFGPTLIQNNYLEGAAENFITGGNDGIGLSLISVAGLAQRNIRLIGNYFKKKPEWRVTTGSGVPTMPCMVGEYRQNTSGGQWYQCTALPNTWSTTGTTPLYYVQKNIFELKDGQGVELYGNVLEKSWRDDLWGQPGSGVLLNQSGNYTPNYDIRDVKIHGNLFKEVNAGVNYGNSNNLLTPNGITRTKSIIVENNIFANVGAPYLRESVPSSRGYTFHKGDDLTFRHNTYYSYPGDVTYGYYVIVASSDDTFPDMRGTNVLNDNIWDKSRSDGQAFFFNSFDRHCAYLNYLPQTGAVMVMKKNLFINTGTTADDCVGTSGSVFPADTVNFGVITDVLEDPANNDFRVKAAATAAKGTATDGLDIGANAELVGWATAGAVSGAINDFLNFRIQPVTTVTTSGATIRFTAPNTGAVTWTVSTSRAMGSTVGSTSQSRTGLAGVATITGLSSNTRYWARATDGASRWLDVEFSTR